ncbi:putative glucan synthasis protein [Methylorubrum populi]|uniref:Putative glucan synthasis protein n=1 Tax=Methylorubrum populi TaxID=223967 RepID=A0A169R6V5_9HYPH|nr:SMI1/KNR4 family protein [Methylorubrum populi]BAU91842.1 putative glucan synthasis protein [Methylorubrum populi]
MATTDPTALAAELGRLVDAIAAGADQARTGGDILRLRDGLNRGWDGAKPGAHLSEEVYLALRRRCEAAHAHLTERFVALRDTVPQSEPRLVIDSDAPNHATFFEADAPAADWATDAEAAIGAAEARLGVRLPETLRALYRRRNGGATDFVLATDRPDAPMEFEGDAAVREGEEIWHTVLPGFGLSPLERLETLGAIADGIDFGPELGDEEESWRAALPGIDRMIPISSHGSDLWLCLDYTEASPEPSIVLFDAVSPDGGPGRITFRRPDFARFFAGLRRHGITVEDGIAMRGSRLLGEDA